MHPQLGLVCITQSKDVRYRTVTRKRLLELPPDGQRRLLDEIYRDNLRTFEAALRYCERESISLYRILSSIFPFADEDVGRETLRPLGDALADAGRYALERGIRLVMHPDADLIDVMPACYVHAPYIEIEAKSKEEAIRKLRAWQSGAAGTAV